MKRNVNILLLLVVAACAFSLWQALSPDAVEEKMPAGALPSPPRDMTPAVSEAMPPWLAADKPNIHLVILNGTNVAGLARDVSLALTLQGCVTQRVGNAPHKDFERSLLVNRRLGAKEAAQLAARLGDLLVIEEKDNRTHEDALLVLGADYHTLLKALGMPEVSATDTN